MKLSEFRLSSLITGLCSAILSLLGFACSSKPEDDILCMYGSPTGDFEIKGAVTDEEGNDVADAEIRITESEWPSGVFSYKTTTSNADGQYIIQGSTFPFDKIKVVCVPADPDLEPDSVVVKLTYNKENASGWYIGNAEKTVDFKLKPKQTSEDDEVEEEEAE